MGGATVTVELAGLDDLAARIRDAVASAEGALLDLARQHANDVGLTSARVVLRTAPDLIAEALLAHRDAAEVVKVKAAALEAAQLEAYWELDARFETEGRTTSLVGPPPMNERTPMTAEERKRWKENEAHRLPAVAAAEQEHREALYALAGARDAVEVARARYSVAKRDVDGAVAELTALSVVLRPGGNG